MWEVCFLLNTTRLSCRILDLRNMESAGLVSLIFSSSLSFPHSQALQTIQLGCMMVLLLLYSRVTVEPICGCSMLASNTWGASKILPEKSSFSFSKKDYSHFVVYMFFFSPWAITNRKHQLVDWNELCSGNMAVVCLWVCFWVCPRCASPSWTWEIPLNMQIHLNEWRYEEFSFCSVPKTRGFFFFFFFLVVRHYSEILQWMLCFPLTWLEYVRFFRVNKNFQGKKEFPMFCTRELQGEKSPYLTWISLL